MTTVNDDLGHLTVLGFLESKVNTAIHHGSSANKIHRNAPLIFHQDMPTAYGQQLQYLV